MPNCEIYVPIFSEIIQTNLKIFSQIVIGSVGRGYCKKHMVLEFLTKTFVLVVPAPLTVSGIMMKNSQTYFKNLAVFTEQDFSSIFNDYSSLSIIGLG